MVSGAFQSPRKECSIFHSQQLSDLSAYSKAWSSHSQFRLPLLTLCCSPELDEAISSSSWFSFHFGPHLPLGSSCFLYCCFHLPWCRLISLFPSCHHDSNLRTNKNFSTTQTGPAVMRLNFDVIEQCFCFFFFLLGRTLRGMSQPMTWMCTLLQHLNWDNLSQR